MLPSNRFRQVVLKVGGRRHFQSSRAQAHHHDAVVVGLYSDGQLSHKSNALMNQVQLAGAKGKSSESPKVFYGDFGFGSQIKKVAVVGLGQKSQSAAAQNRVRMAVASGVKALKSQDAKEIGIAVGQEGQETVTAASAEGALLGLYNFNHFKSGSKAKQSTTTVSPLHGQEQKENLQKAFSHGEIRAKAQILARVLMETPSNHMTPTMFADRIQSEISALGLPKEKIEILVRDQAWAEQHKMGAFLSVAKGSDEPLRFLEIRYNGADNKDETPLALVGKGVTFDSGGISIKPSLNMGLMKGDMGGAATVAGAMWGIAALGLKLNVVAGIPLCENMPSGKASKPGDVVTSMSGKTIEVADTDAEGRLILADALTFISETYKPHTLIDLATLTGAMDVALGQAYAGVFSSNDKLWDELDQAGKSTHEAFWRMPLHSVYLPQITSGTVADLINIGGRSGGSCTAAIFLREFVHGVERDDNEAELEGEDSTEVGAPLTGGSKSGSLRYAHIDIAGVMDTKSDAGYYAKGMTGRPTRALIEFAANLAKN